MKVAFDIEKMRPACVLVAAGMGADSSIASRFKTEHWLLSPTSNMAVYEVTEDQLLQLIQYTEHKND